MSWANLLSGLVGAVVGGLLAVVASVITMRQQRSLALAAVVEERSQARLAASRQACVEILGCMITIKFGLDGLATREEDSPEAVAALAAGERIFVVHNALVEDPTLRRRIDGLIELLQQWRNYCWNLNEAAKTECKNQVLDYMQYVNQSLRENLDNHPLPAEQHLPDLEAVVN
jgi:hypothetical protein